MKDGKGAAAPIVLSMGEPAGIGGEIALKAWSLLRGPGPGFFLLHDPESLVRLAEALGLDVPVRTISAPEEAAAIFPDALPVLPVALSAPIIAGQLDTRNSPAVIEAIRRGVNYTRSGEASALVTIPIQKSALYATGFAFDIPMADAPVGPSGTVDPAPDLGFEFVLRRDERTRAWDSTGIDGNDYSVFDARLDVRPVRMTTPLYKSWQ